ncbi:hypothetical protein F4782DRAFT_550445 [Xylaria castorea]|nr:hypothetical protein F4782DRAFT_550445 [Xylaria castorea]
MAMAIPTYRRAPNFSTPPNGPLQLGTIVEDLNLLQPINGPEEVEIPAGHIYTLREKGFRIAIKDTRKSSFGILASFLGLTGIAGEIGVARMNDDETSIYARELETILFYPSTELVSLIVGLPSVRMYLQVTRKRSPIYVITGLKIAHGASWSASRGKGYEAKLELTVPNPISSIVSIGPKVNINTTTLKETSVEESNSFILAYRATKIWYDHGTIKSKVYIKGATLADDGDTEGNSLNDEELRLVQDVGIENEKEEVVLIGCLGEGTESARWIVPRAGAWTRSYGSKPQALIAFYELQASVIVDVPST